MKIQPLQGSHFSNTKRGKALIKEVEKLEKELRRKDKQKAKIFAGERQKFNQSMKSANSFQPSEELFLAG